MQLILVQALFRAVLGNNHQAIVLVIQAGLVQQTGNVLIEEKVFVQV
jgi:hypothetical protein